MKTVLCHGVFDVLHAGHLKYFQAAKKFGDKLIVSVTTDEYVNKGPGRPYFTTKLRCEMVKALGVVDEVVISNSPTAVKIIHEIKPDFYVKGPDYKDLNQDVTGEIFNEKQAVETHGGKLVFTEEDTFSSSTLINKFFSHNSDVQKSAINTVNDCGGIEAIRRALEEVSKLKVLVVGEPILDVYRFCTPEGISSKSPTISARFQYQETYQGGALAIYKHLDGFCYTVCPELDPAIPPTKIRYISTDKAQRIFEVTRIDESLWKLDEVARDLRKANNHDVVVAADFGHGLFEGPVLEAMKELKGFVGLNVQTNSSNFGFNVYTKHSRWDYLCLDTREARLAEHDRFANPLDVANRIWCKEVKPISVTLGPNGSVLFKDREYSSPAFADAIVDATGAGDAYFAITTVLLASGCRSELVPFIGNVFAGLKTKIIGNKAAVTKAQLVKACEGILK